MYKMHILATSYRLHKFSSRPRDFPFYDIIMFFSNFLAWVFQSESN